MDRLLVGDALLVNARAQHAVRAMIDRYLPTVTFRGNQFRRLGSVISDPLNCANLLDADQTIISRQLAQHQVIAADLRRKLDTDTDAGVALRRVVQGGGPRARVRGHLRRAPHRRCVAPGRTFAHQCVRSRCYNANVPFTKSLLELCCMTGLHV